MKFSISSISLLAALAAPSFAVVPNPTACELGGQGCNAKQNPPVKATGNTNGTASINFVPHVLKHQHVQEAQSQHLQSIQEYLANPTHRLQQMMDPELNGWCMTCLNRYPNNDLVQVLEDLADEFRHAENAREFHSLGGWPLLVSLVSSNVHDENDNEDFKTTVLEIRAHAALAVEMAVQNTDESQAWVMESMKHDDATTPLDIVVEALLEVSDAAAEPGSCSESTVEYQEILAQNTMHALEAFLTGNAQVQDAFSMMTTANGANPAMVLGQQAAVWVKEAADQAVTVSSSNPLISRHAIRMTASLLALADDVVSDIKQHQEAGTQKKIIEAFSTDAWCQAAQQASALESSSAFKRLVFKPLQKAAIQSAATLAPHCSQPIVASE